MAFDKRGEYFCPPSVRIVKCLQSGGSVEPSNVSLVDEGQLKNGTLS